MVLYSVLFILILLIITRYWKVANIQDLSKWTFPAAFGIKILVGIILFLVHIYTYGIDELSHDGETFFNEGKLLFGVFFQSPLDYFKLLTGIGETDSLISKYLYMTEYWSAGDLSLVNDSKNVIRVHSIIHFFSGNSVFIHLAVMCLFSTFAIKNLYLSIRPYIKQSNKVIFWGILLVPSTIFWTSSLMKEPMMFFGLTLFMRAVLYESISWKKILLTIISICFLLAFKPYVLACILIALFCFGFYKYLFRGKVIWSVLGLATIFLAFVYFFKAPRDKIVHYLTRKQFDFVNVGKGGLHAQADTCYYYFQPHQYENIEINGDDVKLLVPTDAYIIRFGSIQQPIPVHLEPNGMTWEKVYFAPGCTSFIETTPIQNSITQLIKNIPEALVNSVARPFPTDHGSKLKFLAVIEVWALFLFIGFCILYRRQLTKKEKEMIFFLLCFWLFLSLLIGWTTPVLGAIARYRYPAQLSLFIVGLIILKPLKNIKWKITSS